MVGKWICNVSSRSSKNERTLLVYINILKIILSAQCWIDGVLEIIAIDDGGSIVLDRKLLICVLKVDDSFSETHF